MSLLSTFGVGVILANLAVVLAIEPDNLSLAGTQTKFREVDRVGTHISDLSAFIQMLCHHHGLADREAKLAGCFLLQG